MERKRVLVADGDESWRNCAREAIIGHDIVYAQSGAEACKLAENGSFDLLILGNRIECQDAGLVVLAHLGQLGYGIPVIIHTHERGMIQERVKRNGGIYVRKSAGKPGELKQAVEEALAEIH